MRLVVAQVCSIPETFRFFGGVFRQLTGPQVRLVLAAGGNRHVLAAFAEEERVEFKSLRLSRSASVSSSITEALEMWWWLHDIRPDVVHAHTPKAVLLATVGSALLGIRCRIVHFHGFPADTARGVKRMILLASDSLAIACAHHVIAVGVSIRRKAQQLAPLAKEDRVLILGNGSASGIDTEGRFSPGRFSPTARQLEREKLGIPANAVAVCFIGRFAQDKGIDVLAAAWGLVRRAHPDVWLVLVGIADGRAPAAEESLATLRQCGNVLFTGNVPDVERILAIVDMVVLPTLREGLPYVPLEASSMALPVIASNIPECAEVVVHGVTGTLVPPRSAEAVADAIGRYANDSQLRIAHGRAARQRVQTRFAAGYVRGEILKWFGSELAALARPLKNCV